MALAFLVSGWSWSVRAAEPATTCGSPDRPWVAIQFSWTGHFTTFEDTVLGDLRAGFAGRDIDVCPTGRGPEHQPLAVVHITSLSPESPSVSVEIRDTLTDKRVSRDVDLSSVPKDGRAFAVALATDELVWASWAELALERRAKPKRKPPPQVQKVIARTLPKPERKQPKQPRLYLQGAADLFTGGQRWLGADGVLYLRPLETTTFSFGAGARAGNTVETANGEIDSRAFTLHSSLDYLVVDASSFELGLGATAQLSWLRLAGAPADDAVGRDFSSIAVCVGAQIAGHWQLADPIWLSLTISGGLPARSVQAESDGQVATGASGAWGRAALGLGVAL